MREGESGVRVVEGGLEWVRVGGWGGLEWWRVGVAVGESGGG